MIDYFLLESHLVEGKVYNCSNVSRPLFPLHLNLSNASHDPFYGLELCFKADIHSNESFFQRLK